MAIKIPKLVLQNAFANATEIIEQIKRHGCKVEIDTLNWQQFGHKPLTTAYLGHSVNSFFIYFEVKNDFLRVECLHDNEPIWEDSCVEMFITISEEKYINIEANALGKILAARRKNREDKEPLSTHELQQIIRYCSVTTQEISKNAQHNWNLLLAIPLEMLNLDQRKEFKANLYKCGSKTLIPHYVTAFPVSTEKPDFHRPEYFESFKLT